MIEVATDSQCGMVWNILDRCRSSLLGQGILQWDDCYPTVETVRADIADRRLYLLTSSGIGRAVVTIDTKTELQYSTVSWTTIEPAPDRTPSLRRPGISGNGFGRQLRDYVEIMQGVITCFELDLER
jgi:hypothetical protein